MLRMSVKKAVGRITAGVAAAILVAGGGAGFVGQPAWAQGVSSDGWLVTDEAGGAVDGWEANPDGTLTFKQPGSYTVERTGGNDCRITAGDLGADPGLELTTGDVDCSGNTRDVGFNGGNTLVTLKLSGTTKLQGGGPWTAGIWTREDRPGLVITSAAGKGEVSGRLEAIGGSSGAGIGGRGWAGDPGGNITIEGGTVIAEGDSYAAGIGGGYKGSGSDITISGGAVTATGGQSSAGIGGGGGGPGSDITISGGAVKATGGGGGAGIGSGTHYYAHGVYITGGTVSATGGCGSNDGCGLAIGHGGLAWGIDDSTKSDSVEVTGGSVKTTGSGDAAQIGGITDKENSTHALLTLPAQWVTEKNHITIDGSPWGRLGAHPDNDWAWYAWLSKGKHTLTVGGVTCEVGWVDTTFDTSACVVPTPVSDPGNPPVGTPSSVTVNISNPDGFGGAEYSIDSGKTWQPSNTFSDLVPGTTYHVWARYKGDATHFPSEHLVVDVQTAPTIAPPSVLTSPIYSGQKVGDLKLSEGWTWGNWENNYIAWSPLGDSYETYGNSFGLYKVVSAPAGQHFSYAEQDLPGTSCRFSGPSAGAAVTVECNVVFTVSRAPNKWTTPVSIAGWDFGQEPHQPVGVAEYGEVKFSYSGTLTDGSPYGPTGDVPTHAGRYTLTATVDKGAKDVGVRTGFGPERDRDYYLRYQGLSDTKEFEILQAGNGWVTVPSIVPWTFGQTPSTPVGQALHGDVEFSYRSTGDPSADFVPWDKGPSAAGDYLLRAVVKDPDYGDLEKIVSFSVNRADAVFSQPVAKSGLVYSAQGQELVSGGVSGHGRFEYSLDGTNWVESVPTGVEAGQYQVRWQFVPDDNHTAGQGASGVVTVGIAPAKPTVTAKPAGSILFGQGFADAGVTVSAVFDGKTVEGATEWDGTDRELTVGSHEFTGTFTPTDTKNFESVQVRVTVRVDAVAAVFSQPVAKPGLVYTAQGQELVSGGVSGHGRFEYSLDGTNWVESVPTGVEAGQYQVRWQFVPDSNHTAGQGASGVVTVGIAAAKPTVTVKPSRVISFGQGFADAGVTVSAVFDGKTVAGTTQWDGTGQELTVGSHEFTGRFTPTDTKNFKAVPVTVTIQVGKAPATVTGLEAVKDLVFNGQPQALVTAPTVVGGTVEYAVGVSAPSSPEAWESTLPVGSHAGSATVFWRVIPDGNHTEVHGQVPVVIAPKVAATDGQLARGFSFAAEQGEYVIRDGQTKLSFGTDYTFELVNASFESQTADVEITFEGDYTGFAVVKNAMATEWGGVGPVEWKPGSGDVSVDLGEGSSPVSGVQVDDKPLGQGTFHRTPDGKLVVDASVLEGLAPGDHTVEVRLEDGSVIVYPIRVLPADKPAPLFTGEWLAWLLTWPILLWLVLRTFAPWTLPFFLK